MFRGKWQMPIQTPSYHRGRGFSRRELITLNVRGDTKTILFGWLREAKWMDIIGERSRIP
jgi:hypothetical protein